MKKIIYTRPDGGVSIVGPAVNSDEGLAAAQAKLPADAINPKVVDISAIPQDRTFRNAWQQNETLVQHEMVKAREIHRDHLRQIRGPLFAANDLAIRDAQIDGDAAALAQAVARRNALRNVTADPAIDAATTPEELKAVIPAVLKGT